MFKADTFHPHLQPHHQAESWISVHVPLHASSHSEILICISILKLESLVFFIEHQQNHQARNHHHNANAGRATSLCLHFCTQLIIMLTSLIVILHHATYANIDLGDAVINNLFFCNDTEELVNQTRPRPSAIEYFVLDAGMPFTSSSPR